MISHDQALEMGSLRLGIVLSVVIVAAFFTFIGLGTFSPGVLASPILTHHGVSIGLAYGIALIAGSVITTILYAVSANRAPQNP